MLICRRHRGEERKAADDIRKEDTAHGETCTDHGIAIWCCQAIWRNDAMPDAQMLAVKEMELDSLLGINCNYLQNLFISWIRVCLVEL